MSIVLPVADHGNVVSALPFVVPMFLIVFGLLAMVARDRLSSRREHDAVDADRRSSST